ncbi:BTAD domain-containing putative transcriptional regulator [Streptomyces sp. NPDC001351]|uniref:AfsR/SARP family transcriptional regulator n=1 Tax=Streptomyces sp. NPDC001351 TaxID=3364564 RepID=UPI00367A6BC1
MEILIGRVWHNRPPARARENVYAYIARLRPILGLGTDRHRAAPSIVHTSGGYRLDADPDTVDLHRFQQLTTRARAARTDHTTRRELLAAALGLWRGTPLTGLDGDWAARVRTWLEEERASALAQLAESQVELGNAEEAIHLLRGILVARPSDESLAAGLMRAQAAAGQHAAALRTYATARHHIVSELGTEPSHELHRLRSDLLRHTTGPAAR